MRFNNVSTQSFVSLAFMSMVSNIRGELPSSNFAKNVDEEANNEKKDANFLSQKFDDYQSTRYLENNVPIDFNSTLLGAEANVFPSMNEWSLLGDLLTDPGLSYFGDSLSVSRSGSRIAVSAYIGNYVKVYDFDGFKYEQVGSTITNNNDPDVGQVGRVVSMSEDGNRIGFVAPYGAGNVLVYEWKNGDWSQLGNKIVLNEWAFSFSMSGDGKRFIVGFGLSGSNKGSVKVFEEVNEVWTPLGSAIMGKNDNENFGCYGVAMNYVGSRIVVGAPYALNWNPSQGSGYARVYELNSDWNQVGDDLALTLGVSGDKFGESVDMCNSGMNIIVGAMGGKKAIAYTQTVGGWTQRGGELGQVGDVSEVSMSGDSNTVAVGTDHDGAKVYNYASSMWNDLGLQHPTGEHFGKAISLSSDGETIGIGDPTFDGAGGKAGLYTKKRSSPTFPPSSSPTFPPSSSPTFPPTYAPSSNLPTKLPTGSPTLHPTDTPTDQPSSLPSYSVSPTVKNQILTCSVTGDPHYRMWNGQEFNFQGSCDHILIDNDYLQLQARTRPYEMYSRVTQVALKLKNPDRIVFQFARGKDPIVNSESKIEYEKTFEEWFNDQGQRYRSPHSTHVFTFKEGGYDQFIKVTGYHHGGFCVTIKGHSNLFAGSEGMCGNWNRGVMTKRYEDDAVTITHSTSYNSVQSWKVNDGENILIDPSNYCKDYTRQCGDNTFPDTTFDCYDPTTRRLLNNQEGSNITPVSDLECSDLTCADIADQTMRSFCEEDVHLSGDPTSACQIDYLNSDMVSPDPCGFDVEKNSSKFLRSRKGGSTKIRSCQWLKRRKEKFHSRLCTKQVDYYENITTGVVLAPPQITCPDTCASCDKCFENPKTKYTHKGNNGNTQDAIYKTCKWLAKKSPEKVKDICNKFESVGGYPTPLKACPVTCGFDTCAE